LKLFGVSGDEADLNNPLTCQIFPSRLVVPDAFLDRNSAAEIYTRLGGSFVEEKTEVKINRITGTTYSSHFNQAERVPAGAVFKFTLRFKTFEDKDKGWKDLPESFLKLIATAFYLLELNGLGGSSSRGYGMVEINPLSRELEAFPSLSEKEPLKVKIANHFKRVNDD